MKAVKQSAKRPPLTAAQRQANRRARMLSQIQLGADARYMVRSFNQLVKEASAASITVRLEPGWFSSDMPLSEFNRNLSRTLVTHKRSQAQLKRQGKLFKPEPYDGAVACVTAGAVVEQSERTATRRRTVGPPEGRAKPRASRKRVAA